MISLKNFDFCLKKIKQNSKKIKRIQTLEFRYISLQKRSCFVTAIQGVGADFIVSTRFFKTVAPCRVQKSVFKHPIDPCEIRRGISLQKCTENHAGTLFV